MVVEDTLLPWCWRLPWFQPGIPTKSKNHELSMFLFRLNREQPWIYNVMDNYYIEQRGRIVFRSRCSCFCWSCCWCWYCMLVTTNVTLPACQYSLSHIASTALNHSTLFMFARSVMLSCRVENSLLGGHLFSIHSFTDQRAGFVRLWLGWLVVREICWVG